MNDQIDQFKRLEIQEKKLRNRTIWVTALVPLLAIIVSIATSYLTTLSEFNLRKLDFTQEKIGELIKEEDIITARKKIKFLIEANLIGDNTYNDILLQALDNNLVNNDENNLTLILQGYRYFFIADKSYNNDTICKYYGLAFNQYLKSIELNPNNQDARAYLGLLYHQAGSRLYMQSFFESAFNEYNEALKLDSTLAWVYIKKAQLYDYNGKYKEMCIELNKALKLDNFEGNYIEDKVNYLINIRDKYQIK